MNSGLEAENEQQRRQIADLTASVEIAADATKTIEARYKAEIWRLKSLVGEKGQELWSKENQRADKLEKENEKLKCYLCLFERQKWLHDGQMDSVCKTCATNNKCNYVRKGEQKKADKNPLQGQIEF